MGDYGRSLYRLHVYFRNRHSHAVSQAVELVIVYLHHQLSFWVNLPPLRRFPGCPLEWFLRQANDRLITPHPRDAATVGQSVNDSRVFSHASEHLPNKCQRRLIDHIFFKSPARLFPVVGSVHFVLLQLPTSSVLFFGFETMLSPFIGDHYCLTSLINIISFIFCELIWKTPVSSTNTVDWPSNSCLSEEDISEKKVNTTKHPTHLFMESLLKLINLKPGEHSSSPLHTYRFSRPRRNWTRLDTWRRCRCPWASWQERAKMVFKIFLLWSTI